MKAKGSVHLTEADLDFLVRAVTTTRTDYERVKAVVRGKADLLAVMLDDERVFHRLVESPAAFLRVSPYFLFAVLLRQAQRDLRGRGFTMEASALGTLPVFDAERAAQLLEDADIRDYIAGMLAGFTRVDRHEEFVWDGEELRRVTWSDFTVEDLEAMLELTEEDARFPLYRRLGDLCLFLTGMFADYLVARARKPSGRGARARGGRPEDIEAYEELGRRCYRRAAEAEAAARLGLEDVLARLADGFTLARKPLAVIAQRYIPLHRHRWFPAGPAPVPGA